MGNDPGAQERSLQGEKQSKDGSTAQNQTPQRPKTALEQRAALVQATTDETRPADKHQRRQERRHEEYAHARPGTPGADVRLGVRRRMSMADPLTACENFTQTVHEPIDTPPLGDEEMQEDDDWHGDGPTARVHADGRTSVMGFNTEQPHAQPPRPFTPAAPNTLEVIKKLQVEFEQGIQYALQSAKELAVFQSEGYDDALTIDEQTLSAMRSLQVVVPQSEAFDMLMARVREIEEAMSMAMSEMNKKMENLTTNVDQKLTESASATTRLLTEVRREVTSVASQADTAAKAASAAATAITQALAQPAAQVPAARGDASYAAAVTSTPASFPSTPSAARIPTSAAPKKPAPPTTAVVNQKRAHHPSRVVLQLVDKPQSFTPPDSLTLVHNINATLSQNEDSKHLHVVSAEWNAKKNCVLTVKDGQLGKDLLPFVARFYTHLSPHQSAVTATDDARWFKIKVNGVRTRTHDGSDILSSETLHAELAANNPVYAATNITMLPRWTRRAQELGEQARSSIVFATDNEDIARHLTKQKKFLALFGRFCTVEQYTERPPHPTVPQLRQVHVAPREHLPQPRHLSDVW